MELKHRTMIPTLAVGGDMLHVALENQHKGLNGSDSPSHVEPCLVHFDRTFDSTIDKQASHGTDSHGREDYRPRGYGFLVTGKRSGDIL